MRIVPEANPHSFCTSNGHKAATIRGSCNSAMSMPKRVGIRDHLLNGTEQVTLPVKIPVSFRDGPALTINVFTSNTLFGSCMTFLNPIASSNLAFHSNCA